MGIFGNAFGWPHLIVILVIVLLLFGAPKLPGLAKSIGQSMKIFKEEIKTDKAEDKRDGEAPAVYSEQAPVVTAEPTVTAADAPPPKPKQ
jgi:sec-independent protein translocase protein TatA